MNLILLLTFVKTQSASWVLKKGLDKSLSFLFSKDSVITSVAISIKKTCVELKIDSAEYLIRKVFGRDRELIQLIKMNYKIKPDVVIARIQEGLIICGANFGDKKETDIKTKEISQKFLENLSVELPKIENVPVSVTQINEAMNRKLDDHSEQLNKILNGVERVIGSVNEDFISLSHPRTSASFTKEKDDELTNSKYKKEIDEAKILLDKNQHEAARVIYEDLLERFKSDQQVPLLAKFKVYNNLGACMHALGLTKEAAINFKIAFEIIGPTSLIACKNRALASLFDGVPLEGLPFIDAAIAIDPGDNDCINLKATLLRAAGQSEKVIELYVENGEQDEN
jgi:tetratricopeptide (TPR) repeat protein